MGITSFKDAALLSAEDKLLSQLDAIELHHGAYSSDPPYTVLEVFGTQLTHNARNVLSEYGFDKFQITSTGFLTSRPKALDPN